MSRKTSKPRHTRFKIFVKILDDEGFVDESKCGWLKLNPILEILPVEMSEAHTFEEKENGHGSFEDWKKFFEEEHSNWRIAKYECD